MTAALPFKISILLFIANADGQLLLMRRNREPNKGLYSGIGGKLEMTQGESPFQCAIREAHEEAGLELTPEDLHLFGMISEKNYEGSTHWLMFLFDCLKPIPALPPDISEGSFGFHAPEDIENLPIPATDRAALWPVYFKHRKGFAAMRADCTPGRELKVIYEEISPPPG